MRALLASAVLLFALPCAAQQAAPLRIMPIGDSITEGDEGGGYRAPLFDMITQATGQMPNFVGRRSSRHNDNPSVADSDHDGYSAYRIDEIMTGEGFWGAEPIEVRLKDWDPAIVTIHAGTNDAQQNYYLRGNPALGIPNIVDRLDSLVTRIVNYNPEIYVIVAQIVPANSGNQNVNRRIQAFNSYVPTVVARHQALGHRVSLVDLYTPLLPFPHPDGIHPSPEGFQRMAEVLFDALVGLGVVPENPNPGRDDGVLLSDSYSTTSIAPWAPEFNLLRNGSPALDHVVHQDYDGSRAIAALNDGRDTRTTNDPDNTWTSTFVFDTSTNTAGYDLSEIRTHSGGPISNVGDQRSHQAYEVWWSSVDAPTQFSRLGDFHHIVVNESEVASRLVIAKEDGSVLASGVQALQFRFVEPPLRQFGFFGIGNPTRYYEIEAVGAPTVGPRTVALAHVDALPERPMLAAATPNPFAQSTTLRVTLAEAATVRLTIFDVLGRTVATLLDGELGAGRHEAVFDAAALPAGLYVARLEAGGHILTQRLTRR